MEQSYYLLGAFSLTLLGLLFFCIETKRDKKEFDNYESIYINLKSEIEIEKPLDLLKFKHLKGKYFGSVYSFLHRYDRMLSDEPRDLSNQQIDLTIRKELSYLANAYKLRNPELIYDSLSEMSETVMKPSNKSYYDKSNFVKDLTRISQLISNGNYWEARQILFDRSKENTDKDIMWILYLLRSWTAVLAKWWTEEDMKTLSSIFSDWIWRIAQSVEKNDKIATLTFLDHLYDEISKIKLKRLT